MRSAAELTYTGELIILGISVALAASALLRAGFFDLIPLLAATLGSIFVALATLTVRFPITMIVLDRRDLPPPALRELRDPASDLRPVLRGTRSARSSRCSRVPRCSGSSRR
jgi:hypothetical protein